MMSELFENFKKGGEEIYFILRLILEKGTWRCGCHWYLRLPYVNVVKNLWVAEQLSWLD